jgi:hypothetical protein
MPTPAAAMQAAAPTPGARRGLAASIKADDGRPDCTGLTLAEWLCRTVDRMNPARVFGPHHCLGQGTSAPDSNFLCQLLQFRQSASFDETMHGLHNLGERGHHIEIRCVLHAQTVSLVAPYLDVLEQRTRCFGWRPVAGSLLLPALTAVQMTPAIAGRFGPLLQKLTSVVATSAKANKMVISLWICSTPLIASRPKYLRSAR